MIVSREHQRKEQLVPVSAPSVVETPGVWVSTTTRPFDLSSWTQERQIKEALELYKKNPLAHRIIELTVSFVIGHGIRIDAEEPAVKEALLEHWHHPSNDWPRKLPQRIKDLCLYGELLLTAKEMPGEVLIGTIHPSFIKEIKLDPIDQEEIQKIIFSASINPPTMKPTIPLEWDVVRWEPWEGKYTGELFYFKINSVTGAARGFSDLLPLLFWLNSVDDVMYQQMLRLFAMTSWFWDITLPGASEAEVNRFTSEGKAQPPSPGGSWVHSDGVEIKPLNPKLAGEDTSELIKIFRQYLLAGAGYPEHFFAEPAARGVAEAMHEPTYRFLVRRQMEVKQMLELIFQFVLEKKGFPREMRKFDIFLPGISKRDLQRSGGALLRATQALRIAAEHGWISQEKAIEIFAALLDQLNLGVTPR